MVHISTRSEQFSYFSTQLGESMWRGKDVLDFGGNIGGILRDPTSTIDEEHYWCVDIIKEAIERGKLSYPKAHWHFYNRYNFTFNPYGIPNLDIPDLKQKFDYVLAYSVFTGTTQTEMLELVPKLEELLKENGMLAFSFIDPHHYSWPGRYDGNNLKWRLDMMKKNDGSTADIEKLMEKSGNSKWCILINDDDLYIDNEDIKHYKSIDKKSCYTFYSYKYMKTLFPQATILPPVNHEMQHCCVIRKSG